MPELRCFACGALEPEEGAGNAPDPCLGHLEGVFFACCGHGSRPKCYLIERRADDPHRGRSLYGYPARQRLIELGGNPPEFITDGALFDEGGCWLAEGQEARMVPIEEGVLEELERRGLD